MAQSGSEDGLHQTVARMQAAAEQMVEGNSAPWKELCSQSDDATIVGAWGGYERGWTQQVQARYEWAASRFKGGHLSYENVVTGSSGDLAYTFGIERGEALLPGQDQPVAIALRVTHIYRREEGTWKLVHRHADPLVSTVQAVTSIAQQR